MLYFYSAASTAADLQDSTGITCCCFKRYVLVLISTKTAGAYDVWRLAGKIIGEEGPGLKKLVSYAEDQIYSISSVSSLNCLQKTNLMLYIANRWKAMKIIKCAPTYYALDIAGRETM